MTLMGVGFAVFSLIVNYFAAIYANERASFSITDIILSNTRVYDVDYLIIVLSLFIYIFTAYWVFAHEPRKLPLILKSIALFILIRSIFIAMTHLGPFATHVTFDVSARLLDILGLGYGTDLFFSGHTGIPFLLALIFWDNKILRYLYLGISLTLAASVLLGHLHYSIDVFAAFFITYSIFHMCQYFFHKDWVRAH